MIHPQAQRAVELWSSEPSPSDPEFDLAARREASRAAGLAERREDVAAVLGHDADGVPIRVYLHASDAGAAIYLHGGGFALGDLETHDALCRRLVNRSGRALVAVDYRRAPDHQYPSASDDVDTVLRWLETHATEAGLRPGPPVVVGDSAGAQLALVAALRRPAAVSGLALVYPCVDPTGSWPSYAEETGGLTGSDMDWYWSAYLPDGVVDSRAELSPLTADLSGLPPTLVLTAERDPLRDEGEALAQRLADAGVSVTATRYLGMVHGFFRWPDQFDASEQATRQVASFVAQRLPTTR